MVVAVVALFVALGGTGYAVQQGPSAVKARSARLSRTQRKQVLALIDKELARAPTPVGLPGATGGPGPTGSSGANGANGATGSAGATGPPGPAGPGAVKLSFDHGADGQTVTVGSAGPWTFRDRCSVSGGGVQSDELFVDGPGSADAGYNAQLVAGATTTTPQVVHIALPSANPVISDGVKAAVERDVGTLVLSAAGSPTVSVAFSLLDDSSGRCALAATATPAG